MQIPYLDEPLATAFDRWLDGVIARYVPPLTFTELRKGVQALSTLYVERREEGRLAARAIDGLGKRGAFATYYAALHFLTVHHTFEMVGGADTFGAPRRIVDLGCGTGAVGAALATAFAPHPELLGIDRSGWALEEAERTWTAFDLAGQVQRAELPEGLKALGAGDLLALGWTLSEWEPELRGAFLARITRALRRGAALYVAEPLATGVTPWWDEWSERLAEFGVRQELCKVAIVRPPFLQDMDKAAKLDHQVIGARVLAGRVANRPKP